LIYEDVLVFVSYSLDIVYFMAWSWLGSALYIRRPFSLVPLRWWKSYGGGAAFL
jgi:hypothetical protein